MHIITRPEDGQYHVCRIVPGRAPVSVGSFKNESEALEVRHKLDLASAADAIIDEPLPEVFDDLLCLI